MVPASLLDAAHGDLKLRPGSDQDRRVDDPILIGADQFLTVEDQDSTIRGVLQQQPRYGCALVQLRDVEQVALERFVERQVIQRDLVLGQHGENRQILVGLGIAQRGLPEVVADECLHEFCSRKRCVLYGRRDGGRTDTGWPQPIRITETSSPKFPAGHKPRR